MSLNDIRSFEGQSWSVLTKSVEKESGSSKKETDWQHSNSTWLNSEDIALYGKYPGSEPLILALCGYCGNRYKVPALARHLALRHPDGKVITEPNEKSNQKSDAKCSSTLIKKSKIKVKKESLESVPSTSHSAVPIKVNKQPSKVLIQVDRRRVNYTSKDVLFLPKSYSENQDEKSHLEVSKIEKENSQKSETVKLKKIKEDRSYSTYKQNSLKLVNGHLDNSENTHLPRCKEKTDNKKLKTIPVNGEKSEIEKVKARDNHLSKQAILSIENVASKDHYEDSGIDIKRRKILPKTSNKNINAESRPPENGITEHVFEEQTIDMKKRKLAPKISNKTYNPDRHCGVVGKENSKPCTLPLTCKSHTMSLRRAVRGRSKNFDQLLADHHAEKESTKHSINDRSKDINRSPDVIATIQLTPTKIPLVLNPHLSQVDSGKDGHNCNIVSNKNINGVRLNCELNTDNKTNNLNFNFSSKKKVKKRKKKRSLSNEEPSQIKCYSQWQPWYRRIGGLLYTQNNLPTFNVLKNLKKRVKPLFIDKTVAKSEMKVFRNNNETNCIKNSKPNNEYDYRDWTIDFKLQFLSLSDNTTTQVYNLDNVKDVYFKLIPESKFSSTLRIRNESLAISFPPSSLTILKNSPLSPNQFLVQKKRDYPYTSKYIYNYTNSESSSSESDGEDKVFFEDITDIRYSIMEPVKGNNEINYSNHITLTPLCGRPLHNHKFPRHNEEKHFNLGIGSINDGQVCLETIKRLHFVTPSGPMAVTLKQHPVIPELLT